MHIWALTQYYSDYTLQAEMLLESSLTDPAVRKRIEQELIRFVLMGCGLDCSLDSGLSTDQPA
jgi:TetR/AcrR family transcriptional regulator